MSSNGTKYNPRLVGVGLLAGAALGAVWINSRQKHYAKHGAPGLVSWDRVRTSLTRL